MPTGPVVDPVPCSGCGKLIDPLRAGHVAIFDLRFHYFCDRGACRKSFVGDGELGGDASAAPGERAQLHPDAPAIVDAYERPREPEALPDRLRSDADRTFVEPIARPILTDEPAPLEPPEPRDAGALLLVIAVVAGALAVALTLAGDSTLVLGARLVLAGVGVGMVVGRAATTLRDPCDPHPVAVLVGPVATLGCAAVAALGRDHALAAEAATLAGLVVTATAAFASLLESARRHNAAERAWLEAVLSVPGRRVAAPESTSSPDAHVGPTGGRAAPTTPKRDAFDIRPGEPILVEEGEIVPVDVLVTGPAEVVVLPWAGATTGARRRAGDAVVAGATVVRGRLRGTCTWSGLDRAYLRVVSDPRRRADAMSPVAQASRALVERWSIAAAFIGAVSAAVAGRPLVEVAMTAAAVHAALANVVTGAIAGVYVARGVLLALRRGITYRSADAWHRASRVNVAVFCARGTLLLGEPELAEVESTSGKFRDAEVLALAAGAERAEGHPIATAILRAARTRGVRPEGVRNPTLHPGLGVTAVTGAGEELCVGNRALMLEQRISVATAEDRIGELEAVGRSVVLVAVGSRLVGLIGLQDGLRPGARAAVQHLLDAQIEPVLVSGDARETCEAIGRSLDIDHVRPEVLPTDRAAEIRRLVDAGANVAVLGHPEVDDAALGVAEVAVALGAAGRAPGDYAVALASDDVRDAALALALAARTRTEARVGLALAAVPALLGAVVVAFGLLPPAYAPLAALLGGATAVAHARAIDRERAGSAPRDE